MSEKNQNTLFRKKSMDTLNGPESMNDYLRVVSPKVWMILGGVVIFLIGVCIWGVLARIESKSPITIQSDSEGNFCYAPAEAMEYLVENPIVKAGADTVVLSFEDAAPMMVTEDSTLPVLSGNRFIPGTLVYKIPVTGTMEKGTYNETIVTESVTPVSFIFQSKG